MTANSDLGIESVAAYAPAYRITSEAVAEAWGEFRGAGISETAVPAADEDALTMAAEAAGMALVGSGAEPGAVTSLFVGTTTPPYEEEAMGPRLASVLNLGDGVETRAFTDSTRAGLNAFTTALDVGDGPAVVVASDAPRGAPEDGIEHAGGAGAAAVVLSAEGGGTVLGRAERTAAFPGTRFRPGGSEETTGLGITAYDRWAFVETVSGAAEALEYDFETADAVAAQSPNGKLPYRVTGPLGVDREAIRAGTAVHGLGDTGAASPLVGLAVALEAGHGEVAVVGYGSGAGATAMVLDGAGVPVATDLEGRETLSYGEYLRMRGEITPGEPAGGGAYVSVPSWKRSLPQRHRLVAGRCRACGDLAFPPAGACVGCGALDEYDPVSLQGTGTIETATVIGQGGAPPEFAEQQARQGPYVSAVVTLDGPNGGSVSVPAQIRTVGDESVAAGDRVEATVRRIYVQEEVPRYGFKMRPRE